ncbi:hypothetical protein BDR03DRAFT_947266 [Suillus americanus]|nr:hypothetical protein BDR03DRAFT_947266 [Suillus americanus]
MTFRNALDADRQEEHILFEMLTYFLIPVLIFLYLAESQCPSLSQRFATSSRSLKVIRYQSTVY